MALLQGVARQSVTWFLAMQACGGLDALHRTSSGRGVCTTHKSSARRTDTATFRCCETQMRYQEDETGQSGARWGIDIEGGM